MVLLSGAKRLPELGSSLGSGLRDFKESLEEKDAHAQVASVVDANASPRPTAQRRAGIAAQAWVREARRCTCVVGPTLVALESVGQVERSARRVTRPTASGLWSAAHSSDP